MPSPKTITTALLGVAAAGAIGLAVTAEQDTPMPVPQVEMHESAAPARLAIDVADAGAAGDVDGDGRVTGHDLAMQAREWQGREARARRAARAAEAARGEP